MTTIDTNSVTSYWDYKPRERALLSREDLDRFVAFELMSKGVLRVAPPTIEPEPPAPEIRRQTFYGVKAGYRSSDFAYATLADAESASRAVAGTIESNYLSGHKPIEYLKQAAAEIVTLSLVSEEDFVAHKETLTRIAAIQKENQARRESYAKATAAQDTALADMYGDWMEQRDREEEAQRIIATFIEYVENCRGDESIAATFLLKVYPRDLIESAFRWLNRPSPLVINAEVPPDHDGAEVSF